MTWRRGALAALLVALATAGSASAVSGRITQIEPSPGKVTFVFAADSLPNGVSLDPKSVTVTLDGKPATSTASVINSGTVRRAAELVIDTSQSMRGEGITGAKAAALAFLDAVPADVSVGVIMFTDKAVERVRPTTDRTALRAAIDGLKADGKTPLYDGVLLALDRLGTTGVRTVLVLSDGADNGSKAKLPAVLSRARLSDASVDAVAFKTKDNDTAILTQIASAGHGQAVAASRASDIGAAFRGAARAIANQLSVTADVPGGVSGNVALAVTVKAGDETLSDETVADVQQPVAEQQTGPRPVRIPSNPFTRGSTVLYLALAGLFVGLAIAFVLGFGTLSPDRKTGRMRRRLSLYTLTGRAVPEERESTALGDSGVARSAVDLAGRFVKQRDLETVLAVKLERAGSAFKPAEWLLIHAGVTLGTALLLFLLTAGRALPTVLGLVIGFAGPYFYLTVRASRRTNAFLAQLPDTLQLLAGSLSAGYSLPQAVDAVVREGAQPIAGEFNRAIVESRLGVPVEDALENIALRMGSRDFAWVVMAIRIQREVGGNLAELLTTVANTMRERERVRRQVRVLSAEGRLSAWVLGGLPPLFALYLVLVRPGYIKPLFTDPIGLLMLAVVGILFAGGVFWLRKVVQVEV